MAKRASPVGEIVATEDWRTTEKFEEVAVPAAEGHVVVARPRSTTLSARHQVENRWYMLTQATVARAA